MGREREGVVKDDSQVAGLDKWKKSWELIKKVWKYLPHCSLRENTKQSSLSSASQTALGDLKSQLLCNCPRGLGAMQPGDLWHAQVGEEVWGDGGEAEGHLWC